MTNHQNVSFTTREWEEEVQIEKDDETSASAVNTAPAGNTASAVNSSKQESQVEVQGKVAIEQERQLMILALLAEVTALNDLTPYTFYAHLRDLLHKGIIDHSLLTSSHSNPSSPAAGIIQKLGLGSSNLTSLFKMNSSPSVPLITYPMTHKLTSKSIEECPLIKSRYERDFIERKALASGAFGDVFQATNKLDHCDYAIKRVIFSTNTSNTTRAQQMIDNVIREIQCLAQLNHENIVRYYTSWLEPSWTAGSGRKTTNLIANDYDSYNFDDSIDDSHDTTLHQHQHQQSQQHVQTNGKIASSTGGGSAWNGLPSYDSKYSISTDGSADSNDSECSEWTIEQKSSEWSIEQKSDDDDNGNDDDDDENDSSSSSSSTQENNDQKYKNNSSNDSDTTTSIPTIPTNPNQKQTQKQAPTVTYQICMNIQMELCEPTTLADWIRHRNITILTSPTNNKNKPMAAYKHYKETWDIFRQIAKGLDHVHSKGIIHRDLKPANILHTSEGRFKIGDFGLSRKLQNLNGSTRNGGADGGYDLTTTVATPTDTSRDSVIASSSFIVPYQRGQNKSCNNNNNTNCNNYDWQDPMTSGIGTGSYAAPEQLESQHYGPEADIFSLGLILLELFCSFGSAHERAATFHDCRRGKLPKYLIGKTSNELLRNIGKVILACTQIDRCQRPSASDIVSWDVFSEPKMTELREMEMEKLEIEFDKSKTLIEIQKDQLKEKDDIIQKLREELRIIQLQQQQQQQHANNNDV